MRDAGRTIVAVCVLAALAAGPNVPTAASPSDVRPPMARDASELPAGGNLSTAIDPSSWWLEDGSNVTLTVSWVAIPAGCALVPIWFRWEVGSGGSEGTLGATNSSQTVFTAFGNGSGTTTVAVRAAASLDCDGGVRATFSRSEVAITVASVLSVDDLAFADNPVVPNASAELVGDLAGGDPPYRIRVAWADGTVSVSNLTAPGAFSAAHVYPSEGTYEPTVVVTDRAGSLTTGRPQEPLNVSSGFAVAIVPSTPVAEVGIPVDFGIRALESPTDFSWLFACEDATPADTGTLTGLAFGCAFDTPGIAGVYFEAVGADLPFPVATASLAEPVVPPPSISFPAAAPPGEVGGLTYAPVEVGGGDPPLSVAWSLVGAGTGGTTTADTDGTVYVPLVSSTAGTLELSVVVTDSLGVASAVGQEAVDFDPELTVEATATSTPGVSEVVVNVSASAVDGAPGLDWAVVPDLGAANASAAAGSLGIGGSFAWNATYRAEGTLELRVVVVDAAGVAGVVNLTVALLPPLAVLVAASTPGPGELRLTMTISGGLPPFVYRWNDSFGDAGNGTVATAGVTVLQEPTGSGGPGVVDVVVTDALGVSATSGARVLVPPPGPLAAAGGAPLLALAGLIVVGLGVGALLFRFRRRPPPPALPPDPVEVLREAIEPSDGVDRGLVELLAEERGLAPEVVRTTLERLKANGRVRAGRGPDGEEVLAWSRPGEP